MAFLPQDEELRAKVKTHMDKVNLEEIKFHINWCQSPPCACGYCCLVIIASRPE
jgi:hypothetical protein